ncbi:unnamed protein product [Cunninghamella blakesleeana]
MYSYPIAYDHPYPLPQTSSYRMMTQKPQEPDDSNHHHEALNRSYPKEKAFNDDDTLKIIMPSNTIPETVALDHSISKPNAKDSPFISSKDIVQSVDELDIGKAPFSSNHRLIINKKQQQQHHKINYHHKSYSNKDDNITKLKEFDFESSNSKFNKKADDNKNPNINQQDATSFYDKKKSFFDNISCDAKEKSETSNKNHYHKKHFDERLLNMETFGQVSVERKRKSSTRKSNHYYRFNKNNSNNSNNNKNN